MSSRTWVCHLRKETDTPGWWGHALQVLRGGKSPVFQVLQRGHALLSLYLNQVMGWAALAPTVCLHCFLFVHLGEGRRTHSVSALLLVCIAGGASGTRFMVQEREIKARMDTPAVRAVLNMGFERPLVMTTLRKQLRQNGEGHVAPGR